MCLGRTHISDRAAWRDSGRESGERESYGEMQKEAYGEIGKERVIER